MVNDNKTKDDLFIDPFILGMLIAIQEIKNKHEAELSKLLSDIDTIIFKFHKEVEVWTEAHKIIELKYGIHEEAAEIATIFPFLNLSIVDILILYQQFLTVEKPVEKRFICRTVALHMYELLEDGGKALGKQMNTLIYRLENEEINQRLKDLRVSFNFLKANFHKPLKELRHHVSGHKDRNIQKQLQLSSTIDFNEFQKMFYYFLSFSTTLNHFREKVIDLIIKLQNSNNTSVEDGH